VPINKLLLRLSQVSITGRFFNCIVDMYKKMRSSVKVDKNHITELFSCNIGLRQGCMLSPSFFSIFISILHEMIEKRGGKGIKTGNMNEIKSLFFADDIVFIADTVYDLQKHINTLARFCEEWGLDVNITKTKVIVFRRGGRISQNERWYYKGKRIEVVSTYKYLGLELSPGNTWGKATRTLSDQANKAMAQLRLISRKVGGLQFHSFFKVFDASVASILLYGSEIWGFGQYDLIERVQTKACKFFLGVNSSTPNCAALGECGRPLLFTCQVIKSIKYWLRILKLSENRYPKIVYKMLHKLDEKGKTTWASAVKNVLFSYGFGYAWFAQEVGNESVFLSFFCERVFDISHQEWTADVASNGRMVTYRDVKFMRVSEYYLDIFKDNRFITAMARLRCSSHCLRVETGRRENLLFDERICFLCDDGDVEDECHFLLKCSFFNDYRMKYFPSCLNVRPTMTNFITFMTSTNEQVLKEIATYCHFALHTRYNIEKNINI